MNRAIIATCLLLLTAACGDAARPGGTPVAAPADAEAKATATAPPAAGTSQATATLAGAILPATPTATATAAGRPATPTGTPAGARLPATPTAGAAAQPATPTPPAPPRFAVTPLAPAEPPMPPGTTLRPPFDPTLTALVEAARIDLARRQAVAPGAVEVVEVRSVVWPDGALGCPQPGIAYPQVLVEGLFIRLRLAGRVYDYHSGGTRPPFLCER